MGYSSKEIDKVEYYVEKEDGSKKLLLRKEDGGLLEVPVGVDFNALNTIYVRAIPLANLVFDGDSQTVSGTFGESYPNQISGDGYQGNVRKRWPRRGDSGQSDDDRRLQSRLALSGGRKEYLPGMGRNKRPADRCRYGINPPSEPTNLLCGSTGGRVDGGRLYPLAQIRDRHCR